MLDRDCMCQPGWRRSRCYRTHGDCSCMYWYWNRFMVYRDGFRSWHDRSRRRWLWRYRTHSHRGCMHWDWCRFLMNSNGFGSLYMRSRCIVHVDSDLHGWFWSVRCLVQRYGNSWPSARWYWRFRTYWRSSRRLCTMFHGRRRRLRAFVRHGHQRLFASRAFGRRMYWRWSHSRWTPDRIMCLVVRWTRVSSNGVRHCAPRAFRPIARKGVISCV